MRDPDTILNEYAEQMRQIHAVRDIVGLTADHRRLDELRIGTVSELMLVVFRAADRADELVEELSDLARAAPSPASASVSEGWKNQGGSEQ